MWAAVWHLLMPSAFDSDALQGYRRTLVEPALSQLARKKRLYGPDRGRSSTASTATYCSRKRSTRIRYRPT